VPAASITTSRASPSPVSPPKLRHELAPLAPAADDLRSAAPASVTQAASISPIGPAPEDGDPVARLDPRRSTPRRQQASGSIIAATSGSEPGGDGQEIHLRDRRRGQRAAPRSAVQELDRLAALVTCGRVGGDDASAGGDVDPAELVPETGSAAPAAGRDGRGGTSSGRCRPVSANSTWTSTSPGRAPVGHILQPQVAPARGSGAPSRREHDLERAPGAVEAEPSSKRSSGSTVGSGRSSVGRSRAPPRMWRGVAEREPVSVSSLR
jgi:hypothetical protein